MLETGTILLCAFGYVGLLFVIAWYGRKRADIGRSIISNPSIYALSLAVYCTAWTFYGSVGRAAQTGLGFLPTYIGPTLTAAVGGLVLRKIIRISKTHRITSIADFIASRYGKSARLGGTVSVIAVLAVLPYISLQLKAISTSFLLIKGYPKIAGPINFAEVPVLGDTAFYVALLLAVFAILFGTRHLDAAERHEGLVAAIAFESVVKLVAFVTVGAFVTFVMYDGFGDIFRQASAHSELRGIWTLPSGGYFNWMIQIFLSMVAVLVLPRQFQVTVVENVNEEHLNKALWLFPLYLFAINIFVLPIAFGGMMHFPDGSVEADTFVLSLPMTMHQEELALFAFLGGMSAATGMVIVETIAISTMICNDLVIPVLLRLQSPSQEVDKDLSHLLLNIRRGSIVMVLLLAYAYFRYVGEFYTLVSIGLVSFAAVAQFAPAILGGLFWRTANRKGALLGMIAGFAVWGYTLVLPSLVQAGLLSISFVTEGPYGVGWLRPFSLFGLQGLDHIAHAVFWSLLANVGIFITVSLFSETSTMEQTQAALFVDVFRYSGEVQRSSFWRGTASIPDLQSLLGRFLGSHRAQEALLEYGKQHNLKWDNEPAADVELVDWAEKLLAGAIGSASARVMVSSVVKEEPLGTEEIMDILDETRQVILYSRQLERTTAELKEANERLKELDRLKDDFISTVTHELRTPLTSVRSLAEILRDNPGLEITQQRQFTSIIIKESERLTRLISQVLDVQKIEAGRLEWRMAEVDMLDVVQDAVAATKRLMEDKQIHLNLRLPKSVPLIFGDADRLIQVLVNLLSNAVKFCPQQEGRIEVDLRVEAEGLRVSVKDNGPGISQEGQAIIFEKFRQVEDSRRGRPSGSGLGLAITRSIVEHHGGSIEVDSRPGAGSTFTFYLPRKGDGEKSLDKTRSQGDDGQQTG
ncbi:MAG: sensor histidine kinase [Desulfobacteraceae bacterium]|nr:sensor histidine kinase [Desulfobacteraceae bacterium]